MLKTLDIYIIKKFLGTFFFSIVLIISIAIVFDISERIDDFIQRDAPIGAIVFDYYLNFIPYFANLFSPLFIFISVIFFTSKMAYQSEIIAMLSSGMSFRRLMVPYFISALILAVFSFILTNWVIPPAKKRMYNFETLYVKNAYRNFDRHIHRQTQPGIFMYLEDYDIESNIGFKFSLERFEKGRLVSKLMADNILWDSTINKWKVNNYYIRTYNGILETLEKGTRTDTVFGIYPSDFTMRTEYVETMDYAELNRFIDKKRMEGTEKIETYLVQKYQRTAGPFSTFILTLIGVSLACRKVRGGIGLHLGLGLFLSFSYILFMQISTNFAIGSNVNPILAVWIPNILFAIIGIVLYRLAPK